MKVYSCVGAAPELDIEVGTTDEEWNAFINKVNESLNPFDLEVKYTADEVSWVKMWALVCTTYCNISSDILIGFYHLAGQY